MKVMQTLVLVAALAGVTLAGPISMSNNNIGDIVKVDVEAEVDIKSEINVELVNVIAELLLELRDVNVNVCAGSSSSESNSSSSSSSSSASSSSEGTSEEASSEEASEEVTQGPITTTGTLPPPTSIGPGTQTTIVTTTVMPDALPYQQLVRSLAQSKPAGYDAPGLTKQQKEVLWRRHVEQQLQQQVEKLH